MQKYKLKKKVIKCLRENKIFQIEQKQLKSKITIFYSQFTNKKLNKLTNA